jgi:hypothetical protein
MIVEDQLDRGVGRIGGVGGGSLMTPLLILLFGVYPLTAVGTDLLYAAVTTSCCVRTLPDDVGVDREDALDDAERSEKDAQKAAEELQRRPFG